MTDIVVEITENNTQVTVSDPDVIVVTDVLPAASAAASAIAAAAFEAAAAASETTASAAAATATTQAGISTTQAGIATTAAGTATTQASLASGYATDAQGYMTSALGYRDAAQAAATTATTQAGIATAQASLASGYADAAAVSAAAAAAAVALGVAAGTLPASFTTLKASEHIALAATKRLYMDGIAATGDTYLVESSANVLDVFAGGVNTLRLNASGSAVTGTLSATGILSTSDVTDASSTTVAALKTAGGLAVAKSLRVGLDTYTSGTFYAAGGNNTVALRSTNVSTGYTAIQLANSGGNAIFGMENSTGGNNLIVGATGYDAIIRGPSGIAFSADNGAVMQMRLSSTGLALKATAKLYLDGGGDSYVVESSANVIDMYAGEINVLKAAYAGGLSTVTVTGNTIAQLVLASTGAYSYLNLTNSGGATKTGTILNITGDTQIRSEITSIKNYDATSTYATFNSSGMSTTGTVAAAGATITGPLNAQYGYFTTQPCLSVGADISATTLTNGVRKYAVVSSPHFSSATVMPSTIFRADSTDVTTNALTIGGGAGAFTAFKTTTFYAANNNITLGGNAIATISNTGFALYATNKLYLDAASGVGGDTYLVESSANVLDAYVGGTKTLSLTASAANITGSLSTTSNALIGGGVRISPNSGSSKAWFYQATDAADRYYIASNWVGSQENAGLPSWGVLFDSRVAGDVLQIRRAPAGGAMATIASFSSTGVAISGNGSFAGPASDIDSNYGVKIDYGNSSGTVNRFLTLWANGTPNASLGLTMVDANNGGLLFGTRSGGSLTQRMSLTSTGDLALAATRKIYFDGVAATGDTYLVESSANVLDLYAGGTKSLSLTASNSTFATDVQVPTKTPATAGATGVAGTIAWDASYLYACTAANTWKRAALSTW